MIATYLVDNVIRMDEHRVLGRWHANVLVFKLAADVSVYSMPTVEKFFFFAPGHPSPSQLHLDGVEGTLQRMTNCGL